MREERGQWKKYTDLKKKGQKNSLTKTPLNLHL